MRFHKWFYLLDAKSSLFLSSVHIIKQSKLWERLNSNHISFSSKHRLSMISRAQEKLLTLFQALMRTLREVSMWVLFYSSIFVPVKFFLLLFDCISILGWGDKWSHKIVGENRISLWTFLRRNSSQQGSKRLLHKAARSDSDIWERALVGSSHLVQLDIKLNKKEV